MWKAEECSLMIHRRSLDCQITHALDKKLLWTLNVCWLNDIICTSQFVKIARGSWFFHQKNDSNRVLIGIKWKTWNFSSWGDKELLDSCTIICFDDDYTAVYSRHVLWTRDFLSILFYYLIFLRVVMRFFYNFKVKNVYFHRDFDLFKTWPFLSQNHS